MVTNAVRGRTGLITVCVEPSGKCRVAESGRLLGVVTVRLVPSGLKIVMKGLRAFLTRFLLTTLPFLVRVSVKVFAPLRERMEVVEPPEFVVEMELYFSSPPPPPAYDGLTEKFVTTTTAARVDRMVLLKVELNILIAG